MSLLSVLIAITAGIGLAVVYAFVVWWFDRYEKEPWPLLVSVFMWGAAPAIVLALLVELVLDIPIKSLFTSELAYTFVGSSLIAPVVEEFFKGLAVLAVFRAGDQGRDNLNIDARHDTLPIPYQSATGGAAPARGGRTEGEPTRGPPPAAACAPGQRPGSRRRPGSATGSPGQTRSPPQPGCRRRRRP